MTRYAAFLRAMNVGGRTVKMEQLRTVFEGLRLKDVRTVINSGNVLFTSGAKDEVALERKIERALADALGYEVVTFLRSAAEIAPIANREPFPDAPEKDLVQVGFLKTKPTAAVRRAVEALATDKDELQVVGRELHWHVRGRTMDSLIKPNVLGKVLGGPATLRNTTTVRRIAGLVQE